MEISGSKHHNRNLLRLTWLIGPQCTLAKSLRQLQKLESLYVHITLDPQELLLDIRMHHKLRHSRGSDKEFWDCPECISSYETLYAVRGVLAENSATIVLARTLRSLKHISWTNSFRDVWLDEQGQRVTSIQRSDDGTITLQREDGGRADAADTDFEDSELFILGSTS